MNHKIHRSKTHVSARAQINSYTCI